VNFRACPSVHSFASARKSSRWRGSTVCLAAQRKRRFRPLHISSTPSPSDARTHLRCSCIGYGNMPVPIAAKGECDLNQTCRGSLCLLPLATPPSPNWGGGESLQSTRKFNGQPDLRGRVSGSRWRTSTQSSRAPIYRVFRMLLYLVVLFPIVPFAQSVDEWFELNCPEHDSFCSVKRRRLVRVLPDGIPSNSLYIIPHLPELDYLPIVPPPIACLYPYLFCHYSSRCHLTMPLWPQPA
jgi:hypothetical protein